MSGETLQNMENTRENVSLSILGRSWENIGETLGKHWRTLGETLGKHKENMEHVDKHWERGETLGNLWENVGETQGTIRKTLGKQ